MMMSMWQEAKKGKHGKAPHSDWCNYDDLNEYFWSVKYLQMTALKLYFLFSLAIYVN